VYDITIEETADEWEVAAVGKHPRPPGDELHIYVDKKSGKVRVRLGE
jgi:hypothetical protein